MVRWRSGASRQVVGTVPDRSVVETLLFNGVRGGGQSELANAALANGQQKNWWADDVDWHSRGTDDGGMTVTGTGGQTMP